MQGDGHFRTRRSIAYFVVTHGIIDKGTLPLDKCFIVCTFQATDATAAAAVITIELMLWLIAALTNLTFYDSHPTTVARMVVDW
jgi:hypothetical protein